MVVRWPEGVVTDESLDRYLAESVQDLSRRTVHCVMHDSRTAMGLSAAQRRRMAAHLAQHEHAIRQWTSGVAIVSPSARPSAALYLRPVSIISVMRSAPMMRLTRTDAPPPT